MRAEERVEAATGEENGTRAYPEVGPGSANCQGGALVAVHGVPRADGRERKRWSRPQATLEQPSMLLLCTGMVESKGLEPVWGGETTDAESVARRPAAPG